MDPPAASDAPTREVDYEKLGKENIQGMMKPRVTVNKADSAALLVQYESLLLLAGSKLSENTREQYERALAQFRVWCATVPHVDERVAQRTQNTDALVAEFRRDMETAFCIVMIICAVALIVSMGTLLAVVYLTVAQRSALAAAAQVPPMAPLTNNDTANHNITIPPPATPKEQPPPPKYHLLGLGTPFATSCDPIYPNSSADELGFDLGEVRYSLRHALLYGDQRISAANAIYIGFPHCYTVINTNYSGGQPQYHSGDDPVVEMFNLRLAGYTPENRTRVRERHIECDRSEWFVRFKSIWVQYEDATGRTVERRFDGPMAFELQHMIELNFGRFRCNERQREEMSREIQYALAFATRDARPYGEKQLEWTLPPAISTPTPTEAPQLPDK